MVSLNHGAILQTKKSHGNIAVYQSVQLEETVAEKDGLNARRMKNAAQDSPVTTLNALSVGSFVIRSIVNLIITFALGQWIQISCNQQKIDFNCGKSKELASFSFAKLL